MPNLTQTPGDTFNRKCKTKLRRGRCPSGVSMQVWSKSTIWFMRKSADNAHFYSLYSVVTLKIRSRLPKSDQIFKLSQRYNI